MAVLHIDSWDHISNAQLATKWVVSPPGGTGGGAVSISAVGRRSTSGLLMRGNPNSAPSGQVFKSFVPGDNTCIMGFGLKWTGINTIYNFFDSPRILSVRKLGVIQVALKINPSSGLLEAWKGGQTTLLATSSTALPVGTSVFLEFKTVVGLGTAGLIEVRMNGAAIGLTLPGINTADQGSAGYDQISLAWINAQAGTGGVAMQLDYDDFYCLDGTGPAPWNDFIGDCRVDANKVTAEGDLSQFAPLTGVDNAAMVNQTTPDDDTTYVSSVTPGDIDTYVVQDMAVPGSGPTAVQLVVYAKKAAEGLAPTSGVIRIGGVNYLVPLVNLGTTYGCRMGPVGPNPATGLPFTEAEFNAAQFGFARG